MHSATRNLNKTSVLLILAQSIFMKLDSTPSSLKRYSQNSKTKKGIHLQACFYTVTVIGKCIIEGSTYQQCRFKYYWSQKLTQPHRQEIIRVTMNMRQQYIELRKYSRSYTTGAKIDDSFPNYFLALLLKPYWRYGHHQCWRESGRCVHLQCRDRIEWAHTANNEPFWRTLQFRTRIRNKWSSFYIHLNT